jgi:hypothetical protein
MEGTLYTQAWEITERILIRLDAAVHKAGAKLVVFIIPAQHQIHPDAERNPDNVRLKTILKQNRILHIDLLPAFREAPRKARLYHIDGHWNQEGHALASQQVYQELVQFKLIPGY